ncbi:MAG: ABC transporter substrate-binding protein [Lachnospiraceae bacterium]|nr:ABC transporter substrate-binding protein [Lachnospiraceae bacterium]
MKRKVLAVLLAASMTLSMAACGSSSSTSSSSSGTESTAETEEVEDTTYADDTADAGITNENADADAENVQHDVINVAIEADPGDLSPFGPNNTGRTAMLECIYQTLGYSVNGEIIGVLMQDWEIVESDEGSYMDITLYDYIYDSAGNNLTASDVVFSYDKAIEIGNVSGLGFIKNMEVLDTYQVRVNFNTVLYVYDVETMLDNLYIVTQAAYEASEDGMVTTPVSTAPYQVTDYVAGYIITCEAVDNYWQTDESLIYERDYANVDTINYYILTESTQRTLALQSGEVDMCWSVKSEDVDSLASTGDYWVYQAADNLVKQIFCNCDESHETADVNLRKAIYYAINSDIILQSAFGGVGIICHDTAAPKAPDYLDAWDEEDNYYQFDLEKAQEYLDAWGGDPSSLNLVILCSNDEADAAIAQLVQGFIGQIGITSTILSVDSATTSTYSNDPSQWDIFIGGKATGNYVTTSWKNCFSQTFFSWGGSMNFVYDDELESLLTTARLLATHNDETVDAVHQYIVENAYGYGSINLVNNYILPSCISYVSCSYKGAVMPGGCTYTE